VNYTGTKKQTTNPQTKSNPQPMKFKLLTTATSDSMLSVSAMSYVDYTTQKNQKQSTRTGL